MKEHKQNLDESLYILFSFLIEAVKRFALLSFGSAFWRLGFSTDYTHKVWLKLFATIIFQDVEKICCVVKFFAYFWIIYSFLMNSKMDLIRLSHGKNTKKFNVALNCLRFSFHSIAIHLDVSTIWNSLHVFPSVQGENSHSTKHSDLFQMEKRRKMSTRKKTKLSPAFSAPNQMEANLINGLQNKRCISLKWLKNLL